MPRPDASPRFPGFVMPRYTPVPDALFDELLPDLSGAELKVLLYIVRRTLGFKKDRDAISLGQICSGIRTRSGASLDHGTGLARSTAVAAIRSLEDWGIIVGVRRHSATRGREATAFQLHLADPSSEIAPGQFDQRPSPSPRSLPAPVRKLHRQEPESQDTGKQETDLTESTSGCPAPGAEEHTSVIRKVFTDLSAEFGDTAHAPANATRALRLWRASGLSRYDFVTLAYEAKRLTRRAQGQQAPGTVIAAKGAYLFAVLERLLAARTDNLSGRGPPASGPPTSQGR